MPCHLVCRWHFQGCSTHTFHFLYLQPHVFPSVVFGDNNDRVLPAHFTTPSQKAPILALEAKKSGSQRKPEVWTLFQCGLQGGRCYTQQRRLLSMQNNGQLRTKQSMQNNWLSGTLLLELKAFPHHIEWRHFWSGLLLWHCSLRTVGVKIFPQI